ncbi:hypothetical protein ILUMI_23802 [Ignelater luminosus]|uniref:Uncharacterized protein n=1 Tax=Ignelater luminosus TaxID=2038154 RepID=A0A8K0CDX5_IGNLU|nr:hypothetical protein ILUMI_23802 [Ignelater luminosus]
MTETKETPTFCKINLRIETLDELKQIQERAAKLRELLEDNCLDLGDGASGHHCLRVLTVPLTDDYTQTDTGKPLPRFNDKNYKDGLIKPASKRESIKKEKGLSKPKFRSKL